MREQAYPRADRRGTAPEADLTARSYNQTAALPAHLSTRITRIATIRAITVNVVALFGALRCQRQTMGYTELRALGEWDDARIHAACSHVSTQHTAITHHIEAAFVVDGGATPEGAVLAGEIGDGALTGAASDRQANAMRDLLPLASADIASDTAPDLTRLDAVRYAWLTRTMGAFNLGCADLLDCEDVRQLGSVPRDWLHTTLGATPTQAEPRCAALAAGLYPSPAVETSTALSLIRVTGASYAADPS